MGYINEIFKNIFVLQIYREKRKPEWRVERERGERENLGRMGKRGKDRLWKLLGGRCFTPHQGQNASIKRLPSWRRPSRQAAHREQKPVGGTVIRTTRGAEPGLYGSFQNPDESFKNRGKP